MKDHDHQEWLESEKAKKAERTRDDKNTPQPPAKGGGDGARAVKRERGESDERETNRWWHGTNS